MSVTWARSADKHGIPHEDALHAIGNADYVESDFEEPRLPGRSGRPSSLGRRASAGGPLLEVMVELSPPRDLHIFHVMIARQKHLDRMGQTS